jgi:hypothetical protein
MLKGFMSEMPGKSYRVHPGKGNEYRTGGNKSYGVPSSPEKPQSRVGRQYNPDSS